MNVFGQTFRQPVTNYVNNDARDEGDEYERDRLIPNLRSYIDVWTKPPCNRLVIAQPCNESHDPTSQIDHSMNKPAPVAVDEVQRDHDQEKDVDQVQRHRITKHRLHKFVYRVNFSQFKIGNGLAFLGLDLWITSRFVLLKTDHLNWNNNCILTNANFVSPGYC